MALLVEGVQNASRAFAGGVDASRPTTSLPPSSVAEASEKENKAVQGEGAASAANDSVSFTGAGPTRSSGGAAAAAETNPVAANGQQKLEESQRTEEERLDQIAEAFNQQQEQLQVRIRFDEDTGLRLFQFVEKESGEVVRQIPPDDMVAFTKRFQSLSGLLFSEQA